MADPNSMFARLKPYDAEQGHVLRTYMYKGHKFEGERGWYPVSPELAEELKEFHQVHGNKKTPKAFDVATKEEADEIDATEEHIKGRRTAIEAARMKTLTTGNVPLKDGKVPRGEERRVAGDSRAEDQGRADSLRQLEEDLARRARELDERERRLTGTMSKLEERLAALEKGTVATSAPEAPAAKEETTDESPPPAPTPSSLGRITSGPDMKAFDEPEGEEDEELEDEEADAPASEKKPEGAKDEKKGRTRAAKK